MMTQILVMAAFVAVPNLALAKGQAIGQVATLTGEARTTKGALSIGDPVHVGDRIHTGKDTILRLLLDKDVAIQVGPETEFTIDRPAPRKLSIGLAAGMILSRARDLLKSGRQYELKTRDAVMGVRGTTFFVKKERNEPSFVCACNGKVAINGNVYTSQAHENVFYASGKGALKRAPDKGNDHGTPDYEALGKVLGL